MNKGRPGARDTFGTDLCDSVWCGLLCGITIRQPLATCLFPDLGGKRLAGLDEFHDRACAITELAVQFLVVREGALLGQLHFVSSRSDLLCVRDEEVDVFWAKAQIACLSG